MAHLGHIHIGIVLNCPQDARPGNFRFAYYAEGPAEHMRDRDVRDIANNPNERERAHLNSNLRGWKRGSGRLKRAAGMAAGGRAPPLRGDRTRDPHVVRKWCGKGAEMVR